MSIWNSLYRASSGLNAHSRALGVVGDNIANVSTVGFRGSRATFSALLGGMGPNGQRLGAGVLMEGADVDFGTGGLEQTGRPLDLAVRGSGFFVVEGSSGGTPGTFYTRDGRFSADAGGYIVSPGGLRLQGYALDATTGAAAATADDIQLPTTQPPGATTSLDLFAQLDNQLPLNQPVSTTVTVFDSRGAARTVQVALQKTSPTTWDWTATADGADIAGGTAGTPVTLGTGTLTFDTNGALQSQAGSPITADFVDATPAQAIAINFGDDIASGGTGLGGSTAFDANNAAPEIDIRLVSQDGWPPGTLLDVEVGADGTIAGIFSNGLQVDFARVALATFPGPNGLVRAGSQLFQESNASGTPLVGTAATGPRGGISGGTIERSNVDLGHELVTLIAYQRAFQANARTVTTADEMLAETTNIKR